MNSKLQHAYISLLPSHCESELNSHLSVSRGLWTSLLSRSNTSDQIEPSTLAVTIWARLSRKGKEKGDSGTQKRNKFITFIKLADKALGGESGSLRPTIFVNSSLFKNYAHIFGTSPLEQQSPSLYIETTKVIPLSSIVLLPIHSFTHATFDPTLQELTSFERTIIERGDVIRQGDFLKYNKGINDQGGLSGVWQVAVTEPVSQGIVVRGVTNVLVLPAFEGSLPSSQSSELVETSGSKDQTAPSEEDAYEDAECVIDEAFLASSVLTAFTPSSSVLSGLMTPPNEKVDNFPNFLNLNPVHSFLPVITPAILPLPVPTELLIPQPERREDDNNRVYLQALDLGRLGLFSGDWVVVGIHQALRKTTTRLVRAFAGDEVLPSRGVYSSTDGPITAYFSPSFLHNLFSSSTTGHITITPSRLDAIPHFPVAESVVVARIASPYSINRIYQSSFLDGLKAYFQDQTRILKEGDLIAIGISEEAARFMSPLDEGEVVLPFSGSTFTVPSALVFFQITSLKIRLDAAREELGSGGDWIQKLHAGEMGSSIDPNFTKLSQAGVERALIPDVNRFVGLMTVDPTISSVSFFPSATPTSRLLNYALASLRPGARLYDLHLTVLIKGAQGSGKRSVVEAVARRAGFQLLELDCYDLLSETDLKTEALLRARIERAVACSPCILLLRNLEALARKSQALETGQEPVMTTTIRECFTVVREGSISTGFPIIIVATTCDVEKIPVGVLASFKEEIIIEAPGEVDRLHILQALCSDDILSSDVSLRALAVQTAALVANDLVDLVRRARTFATERVLGSLQEFQMNELSAAGMILTSVDFNLALEKARNSYSESIGAPKIPSVTWDDVGGLANVKSEILDTIQLPLEHPELFADGLKKRSGILLYGPPGTGKTLLAKAVATSCSLNFFSIKGPELLNMYIGESEANVRRVFQRARDAKPCVIFFDELDSVAPKRGNQGDSGGVMDRIVSQLLAELDGMAEGKGGADVFVIGATNRPDLLDPALLRPGRMLYLGVSDTHESQLKIIQALTRKFRLDPTIQLDLIAKLCPFNYTGADFYALCSDAMLKAMARKAEAIDLKIAGMNSSPPYLAGIRLTPQYYLAELATPAEIEVLVSQQDFEEALAELVPSVSKTEMEHYAVVQERFSGGKEKN